MEDECNITISYTQTQNMQEDAIIIPWEGADIPPPTPNSTWMNLKNPPTSKGVPLSKKGSGHSRREGDCVLMCLNLMPPQWSKDLFPCIPGNPKCHSSKIQISGRHPRS